MNRVHIGIGSNLGDREAQCTGAVENLRRRGVRVTKVSSQFETDPWGVPDQPKFINMAVEAETALSPDDLLTVLKEIEHEMGREETSRYGPRVIDLDILFYGDQVIESGGLRVPHPLLHLRDFVLLPLSEIAPDTVHPQLNKTVKCLYEELRHAEDAQCAKQGTD
ncbi:MAG: 2-amino-4-hydroxy-6-hydroxymethyldihydropteridine diphosphokinase [Chloroflexota bacterium]